MQHPPENINLPHSADSLPPVSLGLPPAAHGWPLVALIGPTNAGKSTLFNRLVDDYRAVTASEESTTRDRVYGEASWQNHRFLVVDTGGLVDNPEQLDKQVREQMDQAVDEADLILFVYDSNENLQSSAQQFAQQLARKKKVWLIANKIDDAQKHEKRADKSYLGLPLYEISGRSGRGVGDLLELIAKELPVASSSVERYPQIAIAGRPNVGKSSLLNALCENERAVVSATAGTTRDIVSAVLEVGGKKFELADTAGVRRRGKIEFGVEQFSVKRTLMAIHQAVAVIVVMDATAGSTRGDLHLIYYAHEQKKPVLAVFNKLDLATKPVAFHHHLDKFTQITVSAKTGKNIEQIKSWLAKL